MNSQTRRDLMTYTIDPGYSNPNDKYSPSSNVQNGHRLSRVEAFGGYDLVYLREVLLLTPSLTHSRILTHSLTHAYLLTYSLTHTHSLIHSYFSYSLLLTPSYLLISYLLTLTYSYSLIHS